MKFELQPLPYDRDTLAPHISRETLDYHYGKHHRAYVDKLNGLIAESEWADRPLEDIIAESQGAIYDNAAQVWNHTFYWNCLHPRTEPPTGALREALDEAFGGPGGCQEQFTQAALAQFGSGWAWLTWDADQGLAIESTGNADNPLRHGRRPILTCDVWEHAYYIDYRNDRAAYLKSFWELVNWKFAASQMPARLP
jgi:Fe-Mn family superoxide dismutase